MTIGAGQEMKMGDHFIEYGDRRLRFATRLERDEAKAFMEQVELGARLAGERAMANQLSDMRLVLQEHIDACEHVLNELRK